jgi:hypothetical protein
MRRKLSSIEHMIEGNIVYFVRLEGIFSVDQLRSALVRVQHKHPALRMLIRQDMDGLWYETDCAPAIPLRIVPRVSRDDFRRECDAELSVPFPWGQPQLRAVWLQSELEQDLLLTTSHRICDGMSMLTIVREVLRSLHTDEELIPYVPITTKNIIGDYRPPHPLKRRLQTGLLNGLLRLVPPARVSAANREICLEWSADRKLSEALRQRCKSEGVSVHAALTVALDRAMLMVLGRKKLPAWIESPMDARRGRFAALRSDMVFFGGGSFKIRTGQAADLDFWTRVRAIHAEVRTLIEQEMLDIPGRYHFHEMLRPLSSAQIRTMVGLADMLRINGSWNRFALSNLGNVVVTGSDAPFRLMDLRLYVHSFNIRLLGLVSYMLDGEMRFYYVGDEKCMSRSQAEALQREFVAILQAHTVEPNDRTGEIPVSLQAVTG